jgi:serine/threonine-protein kinase RsbT
MEHPSQGKVTIASESDIVVVRKKVREVATILNFGVTDITRIVTAASELARNVFHYADTGVMHWTTFHQSSRTGLELVFIDHGPGITDIEQAMQPGFTTRGGLGLGLPGVKRLMDDMQIVSAVSGGTKVKTRKWRMN